MDCIAQRIPYRQTGFFTNIILDYLDHADALKNFYSYPASLRGIQQAIDAKKKSGIDRHLLVRELKLQYANLPASAAVQKNIEALLSPDTFTITTAHQNNIFTGPLYFIYKIIHAIKLAAHLGESLPGQHFVPVFFIGSEDADLEELNHIYIAGEKKTWKTTQKGAVGRMKIDASLLKIIDELEGQLSVEPFGKEMIKLVRDCYTKDSDMQTATFKIVNALFAHYGLIVLLPDNGALKSSMKKIFRDDLLQQRPSAVVEQSVNKLDAAGWKVQANPRAINLFYLQNDMRERIEKGNGRFVVHNSPLSFSEEEILAELDAHPEHFSPNVILRGLYQCSILPDIAFIGGGGELAYWLELKSLFENYQTVFPVLVLRNSFLVVEKKWQERINKLGLDIEDFFLSVQELLNRIVRKESGKAMNLANDVLSIKKVYDNILLESEEIDTSLAKHVLNLEKKTIGRLHELEKKMLKAEKRKFADQQRQLAAIKEQLFPSGGLQERRENLLFYFAKWGRSFIDALYTNSLALEQEFVALEEVKNKK